MIQKGIIAQVIDKYNYKVRIPKYDKAAYVTSSTKLQNLSSGVVCTIPGIDIAYVVGDIVLVSFENDELSKPIILGLLYRDQESDSDISVSNVDSSISDIQENLEQLNSSQIYTHLKYSNDNGLTFTSLFYTSNYETIEDGQIVCVPLFNSDVEIRGIQIDKRSRVINWSIIDENNNDITKEIGIETIVFDSNGNTIKRVKREDNQYNITINNSSQIDGDLYLTYKLYITKEYLDTLHILLTTDKEPFGVTQGKYLGIYVSNDPTPSINPSDYNWISFDNVIQNYFSTLELDLNGKIDSLRKEIDDNSMEIYYKSVEWTQAEVDVYCTPGYEDLWTRDFNNGYTGDVKEGNTLYITVHNTGSSSSPSDDSYGRLEIRALQDALPNESVLGEVKYYDMSSELAINALMRFKSDLLEAGDETLIYGGHIQTGTVDANRIVANSITSSQIHSGAITADTIASGAITTDKLDAEAVTTDKLDAGAVTADKIQANAVTADKLDASDINASNSLTVGAFETNSQQQILNSNIQIGGRNLFRGSNNPNGSNSNQIYGWQINGSSSGTLESVMLDGYECLHLNNNYTSSSKYIPSIVSAQRIFLENGCEYIISCDLYVDKQISVASLTAPIHLHNGTTTDNLLENPFDLTNVNNGNGFTVTSISPAVGTIIPANTWQHYEQHIVTPSTPVDNTRPNSTYRAFVYGSVRSTSETGEVNIYVKNWKVEKGNKATAWSLAPEDSETAIADVENQLGNYYSREELGQTLSFTTTNGLAISTPTGIYAVNIKDTQISFIANNNVRAYITSDSMNIPSLLSNQFILGNTNINDAHACWAWQHDNTDHSLTLTWVGEEV